MAILTWDNVGEHLYETGVDRGVLYIPDGAGVYSTGVAWNGLTSISESPSGGEATPMYADNIKYLNIYSVEEFGATIEAYTYPDEFNQFDGIITPQAGVAVGQQPRKPFGLSYRTKIGNDLVGEEYGFKLHLVYGVTASPSEKAYSTINDSPEGVTFSWELMSVPTPVTGGKPTSIITVDSTVVLPARMTQLTDALWGTGGSDPRLPTPDEVLAMFAGSLTAVVATAPTFVPATGVITIPVVTGVRYRRADTGAVVTGTVTIGTPGASLGILAEPLATYQLGPSSDDDWVFTRNP